MARKNIKVEVGTTFSHPFADGSPLWIVLRRRAGDVWEARIDDEQDYAGHVDVFTEATIIEAIATHGPMGNEDPANLAWWDSLAPGTTLHFCEWPDQFVRGAVVDDPDEGRQFEARALVGNWDAHDLPTIQRDGRVTMGLHAQNAKDHERYTAHRCHFYEAIESDRSLSDNFADMPDPRTLPEIDLTPPALPAADAADVPLWQILDAVRDTLRDESLPIRERLAKINTLTSPAAAHDGDAAPSQPQG